MSFIGRLCVENTTFPNALTFGFQCFEDTWLGFQIMNFHGFLLSLPQSYQLQKFFSGNRMLQMPVKTNINSTATKSSINLYAHASFEKCGEIFIII